MQTMTVTRAQEYGWIAPDDQRFTDWFNAMDKLCLAKLGLTLHDFPDWNFADSFDSGASPEEAFKEFAEEQLGQMGLDPEDYD